ncbi:MAG: hypothetical protein ACTHJ0_16290 [Flavipsychrobacter sp.]
MRALPTGNGDAQWENSIIKDLAFIKNHLRYPMSKQLLWRSALSGLLLAYVARTVWVAWLLATTKRNSSHSIWSMTPQFILLLVILVPLLTITLAYTRTFKFKAVPTRYFVTENMLLIQKFLQSQHLAIYRHPEAPEVFQIMSRNVSATKNEQREVMVFIADDKRILINSHIISKDKGIGLDNYSSRHYKEMAKLLQAWIDTHLPENADTAIVSSNRN